MNRQFDFWVGEWDVQTPQGQPAGSSTVQNILGGCVILENWTGLGSQGKSFNAYNQALKKWQQYWVDDTGITTLYTGEVVGNQMRYLADAGSQNGQQARRMTFTKLGDGRYANWVKPPTMAGKRGRWLTICSTSERSRLFSDRERDRALQQDEKRAYP